MIRGLDSKLLDAFELITKYSISIKNNAKTKLSNQPKSSTLDFDKSRDNYAEYVIDEIIALLCSNLCDGLEYDAKQLMSKMVNSEEFSVALQMYIGCWKDVIRLYRKQDANSENTDNANTNRQSSVEVELRQPVCN